MFCKKCGKEIPDDAALCPSCGTNQKSKDNNLVKENETALDHKFRSQIEKELDALHQTKFFWMQQAHSYSHKFIFFVIGISLSIIALSINLVKTTTFISNKIFLPISWLLLLVVPIVGFICIHKRIELSKYHMQSREKASAGLNKLTEFLDIIDECNKIADDWRKYPDSEEWEKTWKTKKSEANNKVKSAIRQLAEIDDETDEIKKREESLKSLFLWGCEVPLTFGVAFLLAYLLCNISVC